MGEVREKLSKEEIRGKEANEIDLVDLLKVLWTWKSLIIGGTVLCMVIAAAVNLGTRLRAPRLYRATTVLSVADPNKNYTEFIKNQTVAARAIEKLGLDKPPDALTPENLIEVVSVEPVPKTQRIGIHVDYGDPEKARDIANTVAILAAELNRDLHEKAAADGVAYNQARLDEANLRLAKAEQDLLAAKVALETARLKKEILAEEKKRIELELLEMDRTLEEKNTVIEALNKRLENETKTLGLSQSSSGNSMMKDAPGLSNPALSGVQVKDASVNSLYQKLELKRVEAILHLEGLKARKAALARDLDINEKRLADLQKEWAQNELKLGNLTKEYHLAEENYKPLKQRFEEGLAYAASDKQELKVVEPAVAPQRPIKPNEKINVFVAGAVGFFASLVMLVFLFEYVSPFVKRSRPSNPV